MKAIAALLAAGILLAACGAQAPSDAERIRNAILGSMVHQGYPLPLTEAEASEEGDT